MAKLRTIQDVVEETIQYLKDKKAGKIKNWKTGFLKTDDTINVEWGSTITIGGRPSTGKSAYADCLIDGAFAVNRDENGTPTFNLLDCNWELAAKVQLLRRLCARVRKEFKYITSDSGEAITDQELDELVQILVEEYGTLPILFSEEPESVDAWGKTVEEHLKTATTPTVVRIDHTLLTKRVSSESSQVEMLLNLMMKANNLKKKYPVIFMFLTQINREFEDRQKNNTDEAFPRQSDVYGGDAAAMFSESMLLLNKPSKFGIQKYGRTGPLVHTNDIYAHVVKNRNGAPDCIIRMRENFKYMTITEYD